MPAQALALVRLCKLTHLIWSAADQAPPVVGTVWRPLHSCAWTWQQLHTMSIGLPIICADPDSGVFTFDLSHCSRLRELALSSAAATVTPSHMYVVSCRCFCSSA